MDLELEGKVAIVTGGSMGIGKQVARALAGEGARVAVVARGEEALEAAAAELRAETGARVVPVTCDTGSDDQVRTMVAEVVGSLGGVDVLVNCAARPGGQAPPPKLAEVTADLLWEDVNVKVMGYLRCIREVVPHMIARGGGRIVNISGLAARQTGAVIGSVRNVSVVAMTKNLADELAAHHISVVVVHPGLTRTEKTAEVVRARAAAAGVDQAEIEGRIAGANLSGRMIDAREVAQVIAFLASPKSHSINGDVVAVGGGAPGSIHY